MELLSAAPYRRTPAFGRYRNIADEYRGYQVRIYLLPDRRIHHYPGLCQFHEPVHGSGPAESKGSGHPEGVGFPERPADPSVLVGSPAVYRNGNRPGHPADRSPDGAL